MHHIRFEAKKLSTRFRLPLLVTLLYVGLYISFRDLFVQLTGVFGLVVLFLTIAIEHGKVKVGLDLLEQNSFIPQREAAIGIVKFKTLFSTYVWMNLIILVFFIVEFIIALLIARPYFIPLIEAMELEMNYGIQVSFNQMTGGILLIMNLCLIVAELIFNVLFFSAPYLTETKGIKGMRALKNAFLLQKGHYGDIFKLFGYYVIYMISFTCIQFLGSYYMSGTFLYSLVDIIVTVISIIVYESEYVVAKAMLYHSLQQEGRNDDFTNI